MALASTFALVRLTTGKVFEKTYLVHSVDLDFQLIHDTKPPFRRCRFQ